MQASFHSQLERTKWLYGGGSNYPAPPFLPSVYCPCPEGEVLRVLGSSQEPLTCLQQLWRGLKEAERTVGAPPSQAVQALALGVEAVAGQLGLCPSPSQVRWGQDPQPGWELGQGQQRCQQGVGQGGGPQPQEAALWAWLPA